MAIQMSGSTHKRRVVVVVLKPRGMFNPVLISLVLITFIISSQAISTLMSAGRNPRPSTGPAGGGGGGGGGGAKQGGGPGNGGDKRANEKTMRSLIGLVSAEPAPEPSPAATRSASSSSHRIPPMNGSIFGKRSVGANRYAQSQQRQQDQRASSGSDSQQQQRQQKHQTVDGIASEQQRVQRTPWIMSTAKNNQAADYKAIITETIEDFLALNDESKYCARENIVNLDTFNLIIAINVVA